MRMLGLDVVLQVYDVGVKKPTTHIYLDPANRAATEGKMQVFVAVYQNLTGKKVVFDYLIYQRNSELFMQRESLSPWASPHICFSPSALSPRPVLPCASGHVMAVVYGCS